MLLNFYNKEKREVFIYMLKKLFSHLGEYKKSALISPIFIGIEVIFEMLIPTLMAVIIDSGLNGNDGKGDMKFIVIMGLATFGVAMLSCYVEYRLVNTLLMLQLDLLKI